MTKLDLESCISYAEKAYSQMGIVRTRVESAKSHKELEHDVHLVMAGIARIRASLYADANVLAEAEMKEHREKAGLEHDPLVPMSDTPGGRLEELQGCEAAIEEAFPDTTKEERDEPGWLLCQVDALKAQRDASIECLRRAINGVKVDTFFVDYSEDDPIGQMVKELYDGIEALVTMPMKEKLQQLHELDLERVRAKDRAEKLAAEAEELKKQRDAAVKCSVTMDILLRENVRNYHNCKDCGGDFPEKACLQAGEDRLTVCDLFKERERDADT